MPAPRQHDCLLLSSSEAAVSVLGVNTLVMLNVNTVVTASVSVRRTEERTGGTDGSDSVTGQ